MDVLAPVKALDRFQRRHAVLAVPVAVLKKFGDDQGGSLAAVIADDAFFSPFPSSMVFVAVLGFVLEGNPSAQQAVLDSTLSQIPIVGDEIQAGSLTGSTAAVLVVGSARSWPARASRWRRRPLSTGCTACPTASVPTS